MELKFDQLQLRKRQLLLTFFARVSCVRIKLRNAYISLWYSLVFAFKQTF